MQILSIDQGTTNTKAVIVDEAGSILATASRQMTSHYPHPGWVEQSAIDIWESTKDVITTLMHDRPDLKIDAIAIANQRETTICWDAETSQPLCPAITWQCSRAAEICGRIAAKGDADQIESLTGLALSPFFPAAKAAWIMDNVPAARPLAEKGRLRLGTVDSWLLWQLTGGKSFKTDYTNASRTQLFDSSKLAWSATLCDLFGVPQSALPEAVASDADFGVVAETAGVLSRGLPIAAMLGDSHAALFGHGISASGEAKATYGTGTSVMALCPERSLSHNKISSTIGWSMGEQVQYALEGNINVSGQAAQFAAQLLGLTGPQHLSDLAQTVASSEGVVFVPALAGLGAPHWNHQAKGLFAGLTHGSTPAHMARATLDAICLQIDEVLRAMERDMGDKITTLFVDGGGSSNDFLMQLQADISDLIIVRGDAAEVGAIGVAQLAARKSGATFARSAAAAPDRFSPKMAKGQRETLVANWQKAITASKQMTLQ